MTVILWDLVTGNAAGSYATVEDAITSLSELVRDHGPGVLNGYGVELHHDDGTVTAVSAGAFVASPTYVDGQTAVRSAVSDRLTDPGTFPTHF